MTYALTDDRSYEMIIALLISFYITFHLSSGFPDSSVGKESACDAGDPGSIPGSGRSTEEGIGYPLKYSKMPEEIKQIRKKKC